MPAAVFVVTHLSPRAKSFLPEILGSRGSLPAREASEEEAIKAGRIYLAPPDRHLLIGKDHIHLTRGPKEGLHRPSINVTFRSAAATCGSRVIGILLSGMLDDGAAGLWEIANRGGITIVQDPAEAQFPSMPLNAVQDAIVHYRLPVAEMGQLINRLIHGEETANDAEAVEMERQVGRFSGFTCPECRGPLYETGPGPVEFRCRVGHILSLKTLLDEHTSTQERKLYEAIVTLEEGADLAEYTAARINGPERDSLKREAEQLRHHAATIRKVVEERTMPGVI